MSLMDVKKIGSPVLKKIAEPVETIDAEIRRLLDDMAQTMYESNGVGLAAPQVGVSKRVVVIDVGEGLIELINPEIVRTEGSMKGTEGCLSVPGMSGEVERFANVSVKYLNRRGKQQRILAKGDLLSRCLQHEIDHLEGILFVEKASNLVKEETQND
ncbi:peptide deformylase [Pectinatus brassicae]|uniref:Peptide deformylase n=1 Tax=Pectinatus brassicae TaxID=862415 RepID=A0A840UGZ7_9FIRM|nr:peptide deformylase [Pectinatus brassicae]MBB5336396.1 peptide deformylase [Pectinatus brassicae]